ncbi:MAG: glutamate 5-kinase, partial [Bacteroidales bacterium]|nr:glutamate 5-kinase [Bacteroidales bacterium]
MGIIPIINENDTISTHEIEFGDNDTLSAVVASLINADLLILLSDIDGMFTDDPKMNDSARLISKVVDLSQDLESYIFENNSAFGTGGMASKLIAARHCVEHNIDMIITNGSDPSIIFDILEGKEIGTHFVSNTAIDIE